MRISPDEIVLPITLPLLTSILTILQPPRYVSPPLRQFFYISIGLIAHRDPQLIQQRLDVIQFLFQAATTEPPETKVAITEALSMVFPTVQNSRGEYKHVLLELVKSVIAPAPGVAIKFSFAFGFSEVFARGVCLRVLSQGGLSSDLRQSA